MGFDDLGTRMKRYEHINRNFLTKRMPTIIRLDGKAFHTFTKGMDRPFDELLISTMQETARLLCENIMGTKIAYTQSDEITILLTDYENIETEAWFDKNIQKITSISASMATLFFNKTFAELDMNNKYVNKRWKALFDSRVFNLPKEEVCNCFIWRQQDATRNAIQMVGQANFSHSQLQNKSCNAIQEMLFQEKNINFNNFPSYQKRGTCVRKEQVEIGNGVIRGKWIIDRDIPVFTQDRQFIEKFI